jgi:SIR2-like domain/Tetratricopeptide repeat
MAGTSLRDDLQQQIEAGQVVAIVGAGVSVGATNNHAVASWQGLLRHGVDYCRMLPTTGVTDTMAQLLHSQIDAGDLDMMLSTAEVISAKLGAPQGGEWRRWLRETVGELRAQRRDVLEALRDLGIILATTNYDGLIEEVTDLPAVTWRDGARVERVLRGGEPGVLHLHGYWQQPESVILGIRDYEKVLGDAHTQTMQHAMRFFKTLLFVGCGEGLHDPNFGALLQWSAKVFAGSEYRHFRLARDSDVASLQAQHPPEQRIFVLGYGPDHSGLAGFLRGVRPPARSKAAQAEPFAPGHLTVLPPAPRCFGRDTEIEDLVAALLAATPEPVPILGPPGIGKSTITLVALNDARVAARYGQRRIFVRCDAIRTREALAAEIATALGLQLGPQIEPALFAELASAPTALAIDNAETPWEADTLRVEEFLAVLAGLPGLALIASLRGASRPLDVRWRQPLQPPNLSLPDARKVFLAIAGDHFATDSLLDRVLLALDGVPLAIALMAGAAEGQPDLDGTWRRWQDERTKMLQRASATNRLTNIEVSYEISIQGPRMTDEARRLLSLLSFLPGGVAHGDLDAVFPGQGDRAAAILRQVGLAFDQDRRLRLLAPLRDYVHDAHPPPPDDQLPALSHYLGLARSLGEKVGREGGAEAIARLTPEVANIEVAILPGLDVSAAEAVIRAALSFGEFSRFTGLGTTVALEQAAKVAQTQGAIDLAAQCLFHLGDIALQRSDHDTARTHYDTARPLYQRVGSLLGEANCIQRLGDIARERSDHDTARTHYEMALAMYEHILESYSIGWTHRRLARIAADDERRRHVGAAKEAWQGIGRGDLVAELIQEFGGE